MKHLRTIIYSSVLFFGNNAVVEAGGDSLVYTIYSDVQETCSDSSNKDECFQLLDRYQSEEIYQSMEIQVALAQSILPVSSTHPELLEVSMGIMNKLIENDPQHDDLKELRSFIRYQQDPLEGILLAKKDNVPGILSSLLRRYLEDGSIEQDIKSYAIAKFFKRIRDNDPIEFVLSSAKVALETIEDYGTQSELNSFLSAARNSISWNDSEQKNELEMLNKTDFSPQETASLLLRHCKKILIYLNEGKSCLRVIEIIEDTDHVELFREKEVIKAVKFLTESIGEGYPPEADKAVRKLILISKAGETAGN